MKTIPIELIERHSQLGEALAALEHDAWRADLPDNYVPLNRRVVFVSLRLSPAKRAELALQIITTKIKILDIAKEMTAARSGAPDAWIDLEIDRLRRELRRTVWEWVPSSHEAESRQAAERGRQP